MGKVSLKKIAWKVLPRSGVYLVEPNETFQKAVQYFNEGELVSDDSWNCMKHLKPQFTHF